MYLTKEQCKLVMDLEEVSFLKFSCSLNNKYMMLYVQLRSFRLSTDTFAPFIQFLTILSAC